MNSVAAVTTVFWTSLYCCSHHLLLVVPAAASLAPPPHSHASSGGAPSSSFWDNAWELQPEDHDDEAVSDLELAQLEELPLTDDEYEELLEEVDDEDDLASTSAEASSSSSSSNVMEEEESVDEIPSIQETMPVSTRTIKPSPIKEAIDEEEPWKKKDDWWKDPLAMFDENDEFIEEKFEEPQKEEEAEKEHELEVETQEQFTPAVESQSNDKNQKKPEPHKETKVAKEEPIAKTTSPTTSTAVGFRKPGLAFFNVRNDDKQEKAMKAKEKTSAATSKSSNSKSSNSSPLVSLPIVSSLVAAVPLKAALGQGALLTSSVPTLGVLATMYLGKAVYEKLFRLNHGKGKKKKSNKQKLNAQESESEHLSDEELEEYNHVLMESRTEYPGDDVHYSDIEDEEESTPEIGMELESTSEDTETAVVHDPRQFQMQHERIQNVGRGPYESESESSPSFFNGLRSALVGGSSRPEGVTAGGAGAGGGMLTRKVKVTVEELDFLKTQAEKALLDKRAMEQAYEKTSFKLQEAQSEVSHLSSSTNYLKTQLKDYEEMMDRTIRNERRKSKEELLRVKAIMEATRKEERDMMRRQFLKELERVQTQFEQERVKRELEAEAQEAEAQTMRANSTHTEDAHTYDSEETSSEPVHNATEALSEAGNQDSKRHHRRRRRSDKSKTSGEGDDTSERS